MNHKLKKSVSPKELGHWLIRLVAACGLLYAGVGFISYLRLKSELNTKTARLQELQQTEVNPEITTDNPAVSKAVENDSAAVSREYSQIAAKIADKYNVTLARITGSASETPVAIGMEELSSELTSTSLEITLTGKTTDLYAALVELSEQPFALKIRSIQMSNNTQEDKEINPNQLTIQSEIFAKSSI